jgi:hypothetical protein
VTPAIPPKELPSVTNGRTIVAMTDPNELAQRYLAVWNEPDPAARDTLIASLWTEDGVQRLRPPEEILERAARLAMTPTLESRGHDELRARVTAAYEEFVAEGGYLFRGAGQPARLDDVVQFRWEMVPAAGGEVAGSGLQVLLLAADGRIRLDYQFIE